MEYTIRDTPQQNGKAERRNLTLMNKLDNKFWGFAALTAAYLLNRSATKSVNTTPYEMWNGRRPNLSGLEEFGQIVRVYISRDVTFTKKFQEEMSREPSLKVENADIGENEEDEQSNKNEKQENHEDGETEENQGIQQEQQVRRNLRDRQLLKKPEKFKDYELIFESEDTEEDTDH
ncbi:hypothetical protein J437_LFUL017239 [Ladona fulva]|uniref:Uncharacterized protein n=1 Tax=Ladona fulva TaxID=123851 RepID=A0A8K0KNI9_LADFU|nr:hypothetical protein J437_LFUL017239 [Ladona fulva]